MRYLLPALLLSLTLAACGNLAAEKQTPTPDTPLSTAAPATLPGEMSADQFPQTAIVATLDEPAPSGKNIVYTPGLQWAWKTLRQELPGPVLPDAGATGLRRLHQARDFTGALDTAMYQTSVEKSDGFVQVRSAYNRSLRFSKEFQDYPFAFGADSVAGFGVHGGDKELSGQVLLDYFVDEDHFALRVLLADTSEEMILAKGLAPGASLATQLAQLKAWQTKGGAPSALQEIDRLAIPALRFHIKASMPRLEGSGFRSGRQHWRVREATQRTGFLLDRSGALLESESVITVATDTVQPVPKLLYFNKPFLLVLRKRNAPHPYFVLWVANRELMLPGRR